jgi:biotin carboxyl carrier protein
MAGEGPRFRRDLDAKTLEIDGIAYVDATDPRSGSIFRFYDFEHAVAEALDGRELDDVVPDARARSGFEVTTEQLGTFIEKLRELGFLEVGNDDATAAGPPPPGILEATRSEPARRPTESEELPAPIVPQGSTEKLPLLDEPIVPQGSTERLPILEKSEGTSAQKTDAPAAEKPVSATLGAPERKITLELATRSPEPAEELDPALQPRAGELRSAPRPVNPAAELELAPPTEANVVAPDLDEADDTVADLPGSEDPTKIERRPDEHKNTLFGVPFHEVDKIVAAARTATPPPVVVDKKPTLEAKLVEKKPTLEAKPLEKKSTLEAKPLDTKKPTLEAKPLEKRSTLERKPLGDAAGATVETKPLDDTKSPTVETKPLDDTKSPTVETKPLDDAKIEAKPAAAVPAAASEPVAPAPAMPFAPTPSLMTASPFPPASTPAPEGAPAVAAPEAAGANPLESPAVALSAELPAMASRTPSPTTRRLPPIAFAAAGVVLAITIGFYGYRWSSTSEPGPVAVHTIVPASGSTYRWFDAAGAIKPAGEHTLAFTAGGKVLRVLGAGTVFHPGDVIAEVEGGAGQWKQALDHNKQRLAYYEHRLEQMTAENNRPEIHQSELKIAEKKKLIAEAQANLSRQGVVATTSGEIAEAVVKPGDTVKAGAPAVRIKGTDWRAEFELSREDADRARHLGFCRLEVAGKPVDCGLSAEGGDETHVFVDLPADAGVPADKPAHLAKARYDGVYVLPASALVPTKGSDRRVYVIKDGRAESYAVVLADQTPTEIVVTQGLEPGSAVVAEVPPGLRPRAVVKATAAKP